MHRIAQFSLSLTAALAAFALADSPPAAAAAENPTGGTLTFQDENDFLSGNKNKDRYYSQGVRLAWVPSTDQIDPYDTNPGVAATVARWIPGFVQRGDKVRVAYSFGQSIFTPENTRLAIPDPTDRPYAAWLYGGLTLVAETRPQMMSGASRARLTRLDTIGLQFGMVGPAALGKEVQRVVHRALSGQIDPKGWEFQLKDEPGFLFTYDQKRRFVQPLFGNPDGWAVDVTPSAGIMLGNVMTAAAVGMTLRFGENLPDDYGPPRIQPGLVGSDFFTRPTDDDLGWYLFAGVEGRAVAHNIFLDGNSWRSGPSVDRRIFVADLQAGAAITIGGTRVTYTHVYRTKEFDRQRGASSFGALSVSMRF